ncbi:kelch repeat-containing protein [Mucilaginibacter sabulilitoris]|uniref:Kelch repeat-containing protein n=1 Tax=Mucilaginibacter sabulilitoris TaxID=1173583 RepID=A0ABZ0TJ24_9SPHI|nr:kelch repeat-containing protein [Mucilaginibacter sabulilitoris]WPU92661.1 kelch repeat-containing protein [Mucilaginibacter sabulilitoris]
MKPYCLTLRKAYVICLSFVCILISTSVSHAQWKRKADEISKRAEGNNVLYNNKLYVFSGFGDNPYIEKTNEVYDIAADKWSQIAPFPIGREVTHQGIVLVDDNVWIIGGRAVDGYGPASSKVSIYNITSNTWSVGPEIIDPATGSPFPLGAGGYGLLGRTIHVFGGFGPTLCEDQAKLHLTIDVDKYKANPSGTKWENKLAPMPVPRNHINYVVLGGKIYAFGGELKHDCGAINQKYCHVYNPETDTWTQLTDLPKQRSHAEGATFAVDGKVFLVAGEGVNNQTQNTVYQFTPQSNNGLGAWTTLTAYKLPGSFLGLSAKLAGSSFIITNGALNSYGNERKETYIANVPRSTARTLGFSAACISPALDSNRQATAHNLLYVIENTTTYSLQSDASWLTVKKNASGAVNLNGTDIELAINASGLAPGNYTGKITATSATAASKATFCVNITVSATSVKYKLDVNLSGSGTVTKTPNQPTYNANSIVALKATAATGWRFTGWSGDRVLTTNPLNVTISGNTAITANFISDSTTELISNIQSTTNGSYPLGKLNTGVNYYTDRDYTIKTVPSVLAGASFIKTACDDKLSKASKLITFNISQDATIYIAYDTRAKVLPAWLSGWDKLTDKIGIGDPRIATIALYRKEFKAGTISLGGNMASPAAGASCQYFVVGVAKTMGNNMAKSLNSINAPKNTSGSQLNDQSNIHPNSANKPVLYPNPAHNSLQVVFPDVYKYKGAAALRVVGLNGNVSNVSNTLFTSSGSIVNVNIAPLLLKQGMYLLHVTSVDGKIDIIKFIVE